MNDTKEIQFRQRFKKVFNAHIITFETFGVKITFQTNSIEMFENVKKVLPFGWKEVVYDSQSFVFSFWKRSTSLRKDRLYRQNILFVEGTDDLGIAEIIKSQMRLVVGEFSKDFVFIHSSAVVWNGKAILFPATSFAGKTTIAKEFIKLGGLYLSDEFAVLDENGLICPFAKPLSIRGEIDEFTQIDKKVEELGGKSAEGKFPVKLIIFTEYKNTAKFRLNKLTAGNGVLEILKHTLSTRQNPKFTLKVLNLTTKRAIIAKSKRGEASEFAKTVINYLESI